MGIPDELRALDDDLAAGRIDAGSYRARRDELVAAEIRSASADPLPDPGPRARSVPRSPTAPARPPDPDVAAVEPVGSVGSVGPPLGPAVPGPRPGGSGSAPPWRVPPTPAWSLRPPPGPAPVFPTPPPAGRPPGVTALRGGSAAGSTGITAITETTREMPGAVVARSVARSSPVVAASVPPWTLPPVAGRSAQVQRRSGAEVSVRPGPTPATLVSTTLVVLVAVFVVVLSVLLS